MLNISKLLIIFFYFLGKVGRGKRLNNLTKLRCFGNYRVKKEIKIIPRRKKKSVGPKRKYFSLNFFSKVLIENVLKNFTLIDFSCFVSAESEKKKKKQTAKQEIDDDSLKKRHGHLQIEVSPSPSTENNHQFPQNYMHGADQPPTTETNGWH